MTVAPQEERQSLLRHAHWKDGDDEQMQEGTDEQEQLPTVLQVGRWAVLVSPCPPLLAPYGGREGLHTLSTCRS